MGRRASECVGGAVGLVGSRWCRRPGCKRAASLCHTPNPTSQPIAALRSSRPHILVGAADQKMGLRRVTYGRPRRSLSVSRNSFMACSSLGMGNGGHGCVLLRATKPGRSTGAAQGQRRSTAQRGTGAAGGTGALTALLVMRSWRAGSALTARFTAASAAVGGRGWGGMVPAAAETCCCTAPTTGSAQHPATARRPAPTHPPTLVGRRERAVAPRIHRRVGQGAPQFCRLLALGAQSGGQVGCVARHERHGAQAVVLLQDQLCTWVVAGGSGGWLGWGGTSAGAGAECNAGSRRQRARRQQSQQQRRAARSGAPMRRGQACSVPRKLAAGTGTAGGAGT